MTTNETKIEMSLLLAAASVAGHKNTKNRPGIRSVYVTDSTLVATDSYRLVVIGRTEGTANAGPDVLQQLAVAEQHKGFGIPADTVTMMAKLAKTGLVGVEWTETDITLSHAGQTFTAGRTDYNVDFPSYGNLVPKVEDDPQVVGASWVPEYLAEMGKVQKFLCAGSRSVGTARLVFSDLQKPSLWFLNGAGHGTCLYLLMPVRDS
jgi:hypothetical protein